MCRAPLQRAIALAMLLADLAASGVPVDASSIAAAVVADGAMSQRIPLEAVQRQLGHEVRTASTAWASTVAAVLRYVS